MATAVPESLKSVKRFLVQAVQLDKSKQPVVAYYGDWPSAGRVWPISYPVSSQQECSR